MKQVRMGWRCQNILTKEARSYIRIMATALKLWARQVRFEPICDYLGIDLWFVLPRTTCDAHNYGKVLFDALETGGIVTNDKFILPRVMGIWHQPPGEVVIKLPIPKRGGVKDFKSSWSEIARGSEINETRFKAK